MMQTQQFDPFQAMNPSGLQVGPRDPNRRFKQPGVVPDADPSKFGFAQPEDYQQPNVKFENSAPEGYDINVSNDEQPMPNTMRAASMQGYTPQTYDYQTDPNITRMNDAFVQMKALNEREAQIEHDYKPSKVRRALAAAAGIGTGLMTMSPMAGMGVNNSINNAPKREQIGQIERQKQGVGEEFKAAADITGMGATLKQREAEYGASQAGQQNANTNARKQNFDESNPEVTTQKITSGDAESLVQTPTRQGPGAGRVKEIVKGKPNFVQGSQEIMTDASGNAASVNKQSGSKTPIEGKYNPTGESDMQRYAKAFPGDPLLKGYQDWLSRQPNPAGVNAATARNEASAAVGESEKIASAISRNVKATDPDAAYAEAMKILDALIAQKPDAAQHADKARAALRAKYPKKAAGGGGYTPGSISTSKKPEEKK